jgi:proliferating cell nuclear antigen
MNDGMLSMKIFGNAKRAFQIPLIDVKKETKIPQLDFPASIEIKASFLEDGISDAEIISDAVILEADPDSFTIRSRGDNRTAELKMQKGEDGIVSLEAKDHVKSTFSLDYLKKMIKASKISDVASVRIGNDYPLRMTFTVIDKAHIGFVLAPRIEND